MANYQSETSKFSVHFAQMRKEEQEMKLEREKFSSEKEKLNWEWDELHKNGRLLQERSNEVEQFALVRIKILVIV